MDLRESLYREANAFLDDVADMDEIRDTEELPPPFLMSKKDRRERIPAYLRPSDIESDRVEVDADLDDVRVPTFLRRKPGKLERDPDNEIDPNDIEIPAFKRHPMRTDRKTAPTGFRKTIDPMENVPEDEEVPKFLRDRGAKVFPDDIEKPAFARKRSEEIAKGLGAELKRPE